MTRVYEYDVFISYKRSVGNVPEWIRNHFYPRLSEFLDDGCDRDVKIFYDENITVGSVWPLAHRNALQHARILVPVCSPKYFVDEWCLAEWHTMEHREKMVNESSAQSTTLIYPVIFCDSDNFPVFAKQRHMRSFKQWNRPQPQFGDSLLYLDFHGEMEKFSEDLMAIIELAPDWQSDWPVLTPAPEPVPTAALPRF